MVLITAPSLKTGPTVLFKVAVRFSFWRVLVPGRFRNWLDWWGTSDGFLLGIRLLYYIVMVSNLDDMTYRECMDTSWILRSDRDK